MNLFLAVLFLAAPKVEVLHFTADWCGPCQQMKPMIAKLKKEGKNITTIDIDVKENKAIQQTYNVKSIPTFILVIDGKEKKRIIGLTSESILRRLFE
jgi:thiol-disulfide isomerase/thioredoxin